MKNKKTIPYFDANSKWKFKGKVVVTTSVAVIVWAVLVTAGYYFTGFKPAAQYITYVGALTTGLTVITTKRLVQKRKEFKK